MYDIGNKRPCLRLHIVYKNYYTMLGGERLAMYTYIHTKTTQLIKHNLLLPEIFLLPLVQNLNIYHQLE